MIPNLAVAEGFLEWEALAPCTQAGVDPEIFFPERHGRGRWAQKALNLDVMRALTICRDCPVKRECRAKARSIGATCGIWGGEFLGVENVRRTSLYGIPLAR